MGLSLLLSVGSSSTSVCPSPISGSGLMILPFPELRCAPFSFSKGLIEQQEQYLRQLEVFLSEVLLPWQKPQPEPPLEQPLPMVVPYLDRLT